MEIELLSKQVSQSSIEQLPDEVLIQIMKSLNVNDIIALSMTSRRFKGVTRDFEPWKPYALKLKSAFLRPFGNKDLIKSITSYVSSVRRLLDPSAPIRETRRFSCSHPHFFKEDGRTYFLDQRRMEREKGFPIRDLTTGKVLRVFRTLNLLAASSQVFYEADEARIFAQILGDKLHAVHGISDLKNEKIMRETDLGISGGKIGFDDRGCAYLFNIQKGGTDLCIRSLGGRGTWEVKPAGFHCHEDMFTVAASDINICGDQDELRVLKTDYDHRKKCGFISVWSAVTGDHVGTLRGHDGRIKGVLLFTSAGEERLLSWSKDKTLLVWDLETGEALRALKGHRKEVNDAKIFINQSGKPCAVSCSNDYTFRIWDLESGECLKTVLVPGNPIQEIVVTDENGEIRILSIENGHPGNSHSILRVWEPTHEEVNVLNRGNIGNGGILIYYSTDEEVFAPDDVDSEDAGGVDRVSTYRGLLSCLPHQAVTAAGAIVTTALGLIQTWKVDD
jgi:F-box domain/WD domain, G-beta repeat